MKHTPGPWRIANDDSVLTEDDEVLSVLGAGDKVVLEAGTGGFSCESDPYGTYPILEASPDDWRVILAAPTLLEACKVTWSIIPHHERCPALKDGDCECCVGRLQRAIALAEGTQQPTKANP